MLGLCLAFCFSLSKYILIGNKLSLIIKKISLFCLQQQLVSDLPDFNSTNELFLPVLPVFSAPHPAGERMVVSEQLGGLLAQANLPQAFINSPP